MAVHKFGILDYVVFAGSLALCAAVGIYHAIKASKQGTSAKAFYMGERNLQVFPLTASLVVSVISAVTILGLPAEMYTQGTQYFFNFGSGIGILLTAVIFVPLLYPLNLTSMFEYLERRFNSKCARLCGSVLEILALLLYGGTALFAPATALQGVTPLEVWQLALALGLMVTFYTSLGGMKAVIWADVCQAVIMLAGITILIIQGCLTVGGIQEVFRLNKEGDRLHFYSFDPDPTVRHTFWGLSLGFCLGGLSFYGSSQFTFQRFTAAKNLKQAKLTVLLNLPAFYVFHVLLCFVGVIVYAFYAKFDCDPIESHRIHSSNQLLPRFMMDTLGGIPGLPGLLVAALTSGALSTLSSVINSVSALLWEDLLKIPLSSVPSKYTSILTKLTVCLTGAAVVGLTFVADNFGPHIFQVCFAFLGASGGPQLGMFLLGGLIPWANWIGAVSGCLAGLVLTCWVTVGAYVTKPFSPPLPALPTTGCLDFGGVSNSTMPWTDAYMYSSSPSVSTMFYHNITATEQSPPLMAELSGLDHFYSLSYTWYTALGAFTCVLVGCVVSLLTGGGEADPSLILPWYDQVVNFCSCRRNKPIHKNNPTAVPQQNGSESVCDAEKETMLSDNTAV